MRVKTNKGKFLAGLMLGIITGLMGLYASVKFQGSPVYKEGDCFLRINREKKTLDHGLVKVASKSGYGVLVYFAKESEENKKAMMNTYVLLPAVLEDSLDIIKVDCKYSVFEKKSDEN